MTQPSFLLRIAAISMLVALLASGCATYRAEPLAGAAADVLAQPQQAVLTAKAAALKHPRLAPVALDFARPLPPSALAVIAVVSSPDLKAVRARAKVSGAQIFSAGLLPDPTLSLGFDKLLSGPDTLNGFIGQLALDLLALRNRNVARVAARSAGEQVRLDIAWQEWQTAGQARLLASRIGGLSQVFALSRSSRLSADLALSRALAAAARGDVAASEVEARRIADVDAAVRERTAERDLATARLDLNKLLGVRPDTRIAIALPPPAKLSLDAQALFLRARTERLDLLALEKGYQSQEFAVRRAVLDQFPTLALTIGSARDTAGNVTLGPSVNLALPLFNRNRGGIAVAPATREQLRAEYAARVFAARAEIAAAVSNIVLAQRQRAEIAVQVGPLASIVAATEQAARRGDLALVTAETARQSLVDKQLVLAALDQTVAEQAVALELAVGAPIEGVSR